MNYQKIYRQLIQKRYNHRINENVHFHHIVPVACKGENTPRRKAFNVPGTNLVGLTLREHFVAHWLLTKIYKNTVFEASMLYAFSCMKNFHSELKISSRVFESLMLPLKKEMSKQRIGRVWVNNGKINKYVFPNDIPSGFTMGMIPSKKQKHINRGRIYITNGIKNSSIYLDKDKIPNGWWIGRTNSKREQQWHESQNGTIYVTNGKINKRVSKDNIPKGFWAGRTLTKNQRKYDHTNTMKGKRWITNGHSSMVINKDDPLPDGYHYGKFKTAKMIAGYKISGEKNRKNNEKRRQQIAKSELHDIM